MVFETLAHFREQLALLLLLMILLATLLIKRIQELQLKCPLLALSQMQTYQLAR